MSILDSIIDIYEWVFDLNTDNEIKLDRRKIQKIQTSTKLDTNKLKKIVTIEGIITHLGPSFGYINDTLYFSYADLAGKVRPEMVRGLKKEGREREREMIVF